MVKRKFGKHQKASKHYDQNCRTFQHFQYVQISPILSISSMWKYEIFFTFYYCFTFKKCGLCLLSHSSSEKILQKRKLLVELRLWRNLRSLRLGTYWMKNDHKFVFEKVFLEPSCPNPGRREKIKLNFLCGVSKGFIKALKAFIKQRSVKIKI